MKYRISATMNNKQVIDEVEAKTENDAWNVFINKHPRAHSGLVEELPTRAELISENEQLREALKKMIIVVGNHTGEIIQCDTITERQWITAARALAQTRS